MFFTCRKRALHLKQPHVHPAEAPSKQIRNVPKVIATQNFIADSIQHTNGTRRTNTHLYSSLYSSPTNIPSPPIPGPPRGTSASGRWAGVGSLLAVRGDRSTILLGTVVQCRVAALTHGGWAAVTRRDRRWFQVPAHFQHG